MNNVSEKLDISVFPEAAKQQMMDFYSFLIEKYVKKHQQVHASMSTRLPEAFYKPIKVERYLKFDREEIYRDV